MKLLVGHTGFVGSNLKEQAHFDGLYNSQNIWEAFGKNPDLLVYSGVRAEKFLANSVPEKDFEIVLDAIANIQKINPKKLILISTVDVYPNPVNVDESTSPDAENHAYGKNRLYLENWVAENFSDYLIVRLPALFGKNLKKNFIYDLIQIIPAMLNEKKFLELSAANSWLHDHYTQQENGFYKLNTLAPETKSALKQLFLDMGFTALNFTDSRGVFQFYNLEDLWADIEIALQQNIKVLNLATEPVSVNEILPVAPRYDFRTVHAKYFDGTPQYIRRKAIILDGIKKFISESV